MLPPSYVIEPYLIELSSPEWDSAASLSTCRRGHGMTSRMLSRSLAWKVLYSISTDCESPKLKSATSIMYLQCELDGDYMEHFLSTQRSWGLTYSYSVCNTLPRKLLGWRQLDWTTQAQLLQIVGIVSSLEMTINIHLLSITNGSYSSNEIYLCKNSQQFAKRLYCSHFLWW